MQANPRGAFRHTAGETDAEGKRGNRSERYQGKGDPDIPARHGNRPSPLRHMATVAGTVESSLNILE